MITVIAGADETEFSVQRALLTNASKWFKSAPEGHFAEKTTRILRFPGVEPQVIECFLYYLFQACSPFEADTLDGASNRV